MRYALVSYEVRSCSLTIRVELQASIRMTFLMKIHAGYRIKEIVF